MTNFRHQGHCRFETVAFGILWDAGSDRTMPMWRRESHVAVVPIPGSDRSHTFPMGQGPLRITYRLLLDEETAYLALCELVQTEGTLTVYAPLSRGIAGEEVWLFGTPYKRIPDVLLAGLGNDVVATDGTYEVEATFQRGSRT